MAGTDGLAVGLAIGIPSFIVILVVLFFYIRLRKKQKMEDENDIIDLELRDNQSFQEFGEALHKGYSQRKNKLNVDSVSNSNSNSGSNFNSNSGSNSNSNSNSNSGEKDDTGTITPKRLSRSGTPGFTPGTPGTPGTPQHQYTSSNSGFNGFGTPGTPGTMGSRKQNSSYDFYELFIPIITDLQPPSFNNGHGNGRPNSQNSSLSNFNILQNNPNTGNGNNNGTGNTNGGVSGNGSNIHLDNLAKQLNNQNYFDKLPSRSNTYIPKMGINSTGTNSNTEVNVLVQDAINDNYVYGTSLPKDKETEETDKVTDKVTDETPEIKSGTEVITGSGNTGPGNTEPEQAEKGSEQIENRSAQIEKRSKQAQKRSEQAEKNETNGELGKINEGNEHSKLSNILGGNVDNSFKNDGNDDNEISVVFK